MHPVLVSIPTMEGLTGAQRIGRQRQYARRALISCAGLTGVDLWDWQNDAEGRPLPHHGLHWSISHKPGWAAAIIANQPVGIDVEQIKPRGEGLFTKLATDEEWKVVGGHTWDHFFRVWTAKEATLKANGVGIAGFLSCKVTHMDDPVHVVLRYRDKNWIVSQHRQDDHLAAVTLCLNGGGALRWHVGLVASH